MITTGDINQKYTIIGIVGTTVNNQDTVENEGGCGGNATSEVSVDTNAMYNKGADELVQLAKERNKILMVGHLLQYHPCITKIYEMSWHRLSFIH